MCSTIKMFSYFLLSWTFPKNRKFLFFLSSFVLFFRFSTTLSGKLIKKVRRRNRKQKRNHRAVYCKRRRKIRINKRKLVRKNILNETEVEKREKSFQKKKKELYMPLYFLLFFSFYRCGILITFN